MLVMETIDQIAMSLSPRPDKASHLHGYTSVYETYFAPLRSQPVRLLEIGVWEGASLELWSRVFEQGSITGMDIDLSRYDRSPERTSVVMCDQSDANALSDFGRVHGSFNIIIDDGSHMPEHQLTTFHALWPFLHPGGLFVVEDLQVNYQIRRPLMVDFLGTILQAQLHARGFSEYAQPTTDEAALLYGREREIEFIHLYRYLAVVRKRLSFL